MAKRHFTSFEEGLATLARDETKRLPPVQLESVRVAVGHEGDLVGRFIDDILDRIGHFKQRHGKRDGE